MTALTSVEVETYYERVRAALSELPADARDELLEELPDHLTEVVAEEGGSLIERLGEPEAYAAELRSAAGYDTPMPDLERKLLAEWWQRAESWAGNADIRAARVIGYDRVTDLIKALRPGWWVLRGWLLATLVLQPSAGSTLRALIVPRAGGSLFFGAIMLVGSVLGSIWFGVRATRFSVWPRRIIAAAGLLLALWFVFSYAERVNLINYDNSSSTYSPLDSVQDVYVYDQNGNPVPNARMFDQSGSPIELGQGNCGSFQYGEPQGAWTYPLCPGNPGPFQAGPGAVTSTPSVSTAPTDSLGSTPSASASTPTTSTPTPTTSTAAASTTPTKPTGSVPKPIPAPTASR